MNRNAAKPTKPSTPASFKVRMTDDDLVSARIARANAKAAARRVKPSKAAR